MMSSSSIELFSSFQRYCIAITSPLPPSSSHWKCIFIWPAKCGSSVRANTGRYIDNVQECTILLLLLYMYSQQAPLNRCWHKPIESILNPMLGNLAIRPWMLYHSIVFVWCECNWQPLLHVQINNIIGFIIWVIIYD